MPPILVAEIFLPAIIAAGPLNIAVTNKALLVRGMVLELQSERSV